MKTGSRCPRCGAPFICNSEAIVACHCSRVVLDEPLRQAIAQRYRGCLCAACLAELARGRPL